MPAYDPPLLKTGRLVIRMTREPDAAMMQRYYSENAEYLRPYEPPRPDNFLTRSFWAKQIRRNLEDFDAESAVRVLMVRKEAPKRMVGYISMSNITRGAGQFCFLGYSLAEAEQGKGLMREGLEAVISYAFETMLLHRIMANYMPHNQRSGALLRRLGFVVEGYARDYVLINGRWEDHILTSLTNPQWVPLIPS